MGIVIDIILVIILILSAVLGYKKGLVKLGTGLFAGILAIVLALLLYKPVTALIIDKTQLDEKIQSVIIENTKDKVGENLGTDNLVTENINDASNNLIQKEASEISIKIIYIVTGIILFVFSKIILNILISLLDLVAKLPILKQFNETGGLIYGILRGVIIACICVMLIGVYSKVNPESDLSSEIENSYITKTIYKNIVKF